MRASACKESSRNQTPLTVIVSDRLSNSRVIMENSVVLPAPFGPSSTLNHPAATSEPTWLSAALAP
jgi:C4-type Zn-finger protein